MMNLERVSFHDELTKIAEDAAHKGTDILKKNPHLLLLSKQRNLPPLIVRLLKDTPKGVTVTIDPDYVKNAKDKKHRPNGFYTLKGDHIHLTTMNHDTLAHELGHAKNSDEVLGKMFQNKVLYPLIHFAPFAGYVGGHVAMMARHPVVQAVALGAPFLLTAPALISEAKASINGHGLLKEQGATERELKKYKKEMFRAYGSYSLMLPFTAMTTLGGALEHSLSAKREAERGVEVVHQRRKLFGELGEPHKESKQ